MDINQKLKPKFDRIIEHFKSESSLLRTGRATPALVENIAVEYMGQKMLLKQLASISVIQPNIIVIQPWDKQSINSISKVLSSSSSLGMAPIVDKDSIRLTLPSLTQERRQQLIKILGEKAEEARVSFRREREDVWREVQRLEKPPQRGEPRPASAGREKKISEDEKFRAKDQLQKSIDEYNKKIKDLVEQKEKEILNF